MEALREVLLQADIDASSLAPLFESAQEPAVCFVVSRSEALSTWQRLRDLVPQTGFWPVMLGDDEYLTQRRAIVKRLSRLTAEKIVEEAATIDAAAWFENRYLDELDEIRRRQEEDRSASAPIPPAGLLTGEGPLPGLPDAPWPCAESRFQIPLISPSRVHLGLVPTSFGWQTPAFLRFGAWNRCPSPGENVAVLRFWDDHYGAEVVGMAGKRMELRVSRPPQTQADALGLARQHYLFCPDLVPEETRSLYPLAGSLIGDAVWSFRWD
jgi:hypothetical protein